MMTGWQSFLGSLIARPRLPVCHILPAAEKTQRDVKPAAQSHSLMHKSMRRFVVTLYLFFKLHAGEAMQRLKEGTLLNNSSKSLG